jgi:lycopene beta-cyclase
MKPATPTYDYIIAGAGAAGLSLLCHLLEEPTLRHKTILVLDREKKQVNDRTWCFWQTEEGPFESCLKQQWRHLHFYSARFSSLLDISPYCYKMLESASFYHFCWAKARAAGNVTVVEDEIISIDPSGKVQGRKGAYQAEYVFNSATFTIPQQPHYHYLVQHFKGYFIRTKAEVFNPAAPTFMDFRVDQHQDCRFVYVLPVNRREALIEYTGFSPEPLSQQQYDVELKHYIAHYLRLFEYEVTHSEYGVIPMTNAPFKSKESEQVINIGTAGGATKASTGYTFSFIQRQCAAIARNLVVGNAPVAPITSRKYQLYDSIFLRVLTEKQHPAWHVFEDMFRKLPAATILKFLNEDSTFLEDMQIMQAVDKSTFLKAAFKEFSRSFR